MSYHLCRKSSRTITDSAISNKASEICWICPRFYNASMVSTCQNILWIKVLKSNIIHIMRWQPFASSSWSMLRARVNRQICVGGELSTRVSCWLRVLLKTLQNDRLSRRLVDNVILFLLCCYFDRNSPSLGWTIFNRVPFRFHHLQRLLHSSPPATGRILWRLRRRAPGNKVLLTCWCASLLQRTWQSQPATRRFSSGKASVVLNSIAFHFGKLLNITFQFLS